MGHHLHCHEYHRRHGLAEAPGGVRRRKLILSLLLTVTVMVVEVAGGILSGSIALISDAGHMFTHVFALGIALAAVVAASRPACHHRPFGLVRAEILAAFVNSLFLMLVAGCIIYESVWRFFEPQAVLGRYMLAVAVLGLIANLGSMWILRGGTRGDMNVKGVVLHMLADAVSSVAIVAGAVVISYTGWFFVDPLISIGISALIISWGWTLLRDSSRILLQAAPRGMDSEVVAREILEHFPEIERVEAGCLWALTAERSVYTARITLKAGIETNAALLDRIAGHLETRFNIVDTTLQVMQ